MIPKKLRPALTDLVHELVQGNFAELEEDGRAGLLSAEDLERIIKEYPRTFVELPESAFELGDAYKLEGQSWAVDLDLWTAEDGRSDLTLQLTVRDTGKEIVTRIEDLHTL